MYADSILTTTLSIPTSKDKEVGLNSITYGTSRWQRQNSTLTPKSPSSPCWTVDSPLHWTEAERAGRKDKGQARGSRRKMLISFRKATAQLRAASQLGAGLDSREQLAVSGT